MPDDPRGAFYEVIMYENQFPDPEEFYPEDFWNPQREAGAEPDEYYPEEGAGQ